RRRHTRFSRDWSSDVCSSDLGQVNDGIACLAVLIELFRHLQTLPRRRYTYRLILGPEYYAAAAVLAHGKNVDQLKYGFYLDMMRSEERRVGKEWSARWWKDRG